MATPRLVTVRDFNTSRFSQLADTSTANISDILARAERTIESKLQRPIYPTTTTERFVARSSRVYLRHRPVIDITTFTRRLGPYHAPLTVSTYFLEPETGIVDVDGPFVGYGIEITYTAGFISTPEDIKEAILLQAALYAFQDLEIYGSGDAKEPGILYFKDDIEDILRPYKQLSTAYTR